jgi:hypothetical protein
VANHTIDVSVVDGELKSMRIEHFDRSAAAIAYSHTRDGRATLVAPDEGDAVPYHLVNNHAANHFHFEFPLNIGKAQAVTFVIEHLRIADFDARRQNTR